MNQPFAVPDWKLLDIEQLAGGAVKQLLPRFPCYFLAVNGRVISLCNPAYNPPERRRPCLLKPRKGAVRLYDRNGWQVAVQIADLLAEYWGEQV